MQDIESKISELIEKLNRHHQILKSEKPWNPSAIDVDKMMADVRDLYDVVLVLKSKKSVNIEAHEENPQEEQTTADATQTPEKVAIEPEPELKKEDKNVESSMDETLNRAQIEVNKNGAEKMPEKENPEQKQTSLNEMFEPETEDVGSSIQQKHQNIRDGIDISLKFELIGELFGGDHEAYSKAIDQLNSMSSADEAEKFLVNDLRNSLSWDESLPAYKKLRKIVISSF